jgi:hypothetical protein
VELDLLFRGFGLLAKLVSSALKVLTKAFDGVQAENLDQRLPFLRLGLVDEIRQSASAKEEGLPPGCLERFDVPLVRVDDLAAERTVRDDLDRGDAAGVIPHVAHGVLTSFVGQELDLAREVPFQRVGDRTFSSAVVPIHGKALALAEIDGHLSGHAAEGSHDDALEFFIHPRNPRKAAGSLAIDRRLSLSGLRQTVE